MPASASNPKITAALSSMHMLLGAGIPLNKVFLNAGDVAGREHRQYFRRASYIAEDGGTFDIALEALGPVIPFGERMMLTIGWQAGRIDDILPKIVRRRERLRETLNKVRNSMIQPSIVFFVACFIAPAPPLILGKITPEAYILASLGPLLLMVMLIVGVWLLFQLRTLQINRASRSDKPVPPDPFDVFLLYTPGLRGTQIYGNTTEFCDLLANMLYAGIRVDQALLTTAKALPNGFYRRNVHQLSAKARAGQELHDTFATDGLWPNEFVEIVKVADISGNLEDVLLRQAEYYRDRYEEAIQRVGKALSWAFYLLVSLYIVIQIFSVFSGYAATISGAAQGNFGP